MRFADLIMVTPGIAPCLRAEKKCKLILGSRQSSTVAEGFPRAASLFLSVSDKFLFLARLAGHVYLAIYMPLNLANHCRKEFLLQNRNQVAEETLQQGDKLSQTMGSP